MKNDNNNETTTSINHNQPDNQTTRTNQTRTNQPTINNLNNLNHNYSDLNANGQQIKWLIFDSGKTPYSIAKETGVPDGNLYHVKNGDRLIENLSLTVASKLTAYAIKLQGQQGSRTNKDG